MATEDELAGRIDWQQFGKEVDRSGRLRPWQGKAAKLNCPHCGETGGATPDEPAETAGFMPFCDALEIVHGIARHYLHADQPAPAAEGEDIEAIYDRWQLAVDTVEDYIVNQCARD